MAASSKRGWRHSRCAASAPAKPVAPATSTRGEAPPSAAPSCAAAARVRGASATQLTPQLSERSDDPLARGRDVLVGESAPRRAEGERQRERAPPLADLLAFVDVKDADRLEHLAPRLARARENLFGGHGQRRRHSEVL